jgi:hypothetical protein
MMLMLLETVEQEKSPEWYDKNLLDDRMIQEEQIR